MFYSRQENRRKRWYRLLSFGHKRLVLLASLLVMALLAFITVVGYYTWRASEFDLARVVSGSGESLLYDAGNRPIGPLSDSGGSFVPWDDMPDDLINAFVAREDENFFDHNGIVYSSVLRSFLRNIVTMSYEQGASTITMQLTRNVYELQNKTLDRKLLEAALAQRIEKKYDKPTILTQYLNRIYYGQNCYGIGAAAKHYFGKAVRDLNLVECATLAGLVRGPSIFNPRRNMKAAMKVKQETLDRMLEMEFISDEQHTVAVSSPIRLAEEGRASDAAPGASYATLWTNHELESLQTEIGENAGGMAVVSNLNLTMQQHAESALERTLTAVERPGHFPVTWEDQLENLDDETRANTLKAFKAAKRPGCLKVRRQDNDLHGLLQCCVLVVDMRPNRRGRVLAVVGGRSSADGIDRWQGKLEPGRTAAPLVFSCACLPGEDGQHIVSRSALVTGQSIGYDVVRAFFDGLRLGIELPDRENEQELYEGRFTLKRLELARVLFDLVNEGRGYKLSLVDTIWSRGGIVLYRHEPERAPEYIRRESAVTVSRLAPFITREGQPTLLHERLPGGWGQFSMIFSRNKYCAFVWMGFDNPDSEAANHPVVQSLLSRASLYLVRELHSAAHRVNQGKAPEMTEEERADLAARKTAAEKKARAQAEKAARAKKQAAKKKP